MNVIQIVNDTFRRDHLGCYGNTWIHTPNLDRFAARSAVFDRYYVASYPTVPNRWDMCVGRYGFPQRGWQPLARGDVTLAQLLARRGVHTEMIWDTPMLAMHDYNYTRGFGGIDFCHGQKGDPWITDPTLPIRIPAQPHKIKNVGSLVTYLRNHYARRYEREFCAARTLSMAMDWLETNHRQPSFYLYVDMWDPHEPFDCPWYDYARYAQPGYDGDQLTYPQYGRPTYMTEQEHENVRALYAGQVTLVDRWIGYLLDLVERLGLFENTLILWTTDHGHLFGEHDLQGKPGAEFGRLYEVTTRIPLLVYHPDGLGAGQRIQGIVQPPDLVPSILEFMGAPVPADVEGRSFWPLVTGACDAIHACAFSNRFPSQSGDPTYTAVEGAAFDGWVGSDRIVEPATITDSEWAYICAPQGLPSELYHLPTDPVQAHNVIAAHPAVADRMRQAWIAFLQEHGASEARLRPFREGCAEAHAAPGGRLYAFRDDHGQWIAFPTEGEARRASYHEAAPGRAREVRAITFGELLADNPRNLVHLLDQYYWAEDLA
ncbi:MAG: sulfatase [Anaerolineae bacterium]|nr:sulfatase [Anaerolineae bacterium]